MFVRRKMLNFVTEVEKWGASVSHGHISSFPPNCFDKPLIIMPLFEEGVYCIANVCQSVCR